MTVDTYAAARHDHIAWQAELEAALVRGWTTALGPAQSPLVVLTIVRQAAALLVNGKRAAAFRTETARAWGGNPTGFDKLLRRQPIEYLPVGDRHRLFDLVQRLTAGWPYKFVHACLEARVFRSMAIKEMRYIPFAYEEVVSRYLDRNPYKASEGEVEAAASFLRRTKGRASYADLREICGESRAAIYKNMDYVRRQPNPSIWRKVALSVST